MPLQLQGNTKYTRTHVRVYYYYIVSANPFLDLRHHPFNVRSFLALGRWRSALNGTSSIAPEESPLWGVSAIHRTKRSPLTPFAWLSMFRLPHISLFIIPEWYSGTFPKKSTFLKISLLFIFSLPSPILPTEEREKTERTTAQLPANKKSRLC